VNGVQAEDVFRNANEKVAAKAHALAFRSPIPFLCECSDPRCFRHILLTLDEYEQIGSGTPRYVTLPGHTVGGASLVAEDGRFALVEKL
jgi:glyoxylase-like metal-dependent hydrolase (beta-lactamase superfamily II)